MINSLRLIPITGLFCLAGVAMAQETLPIFSDNEKPIFENTYLIDNIGNNSEGADLTLRINKKAPFGQCNDSIDCPASLIVSGANGNVNMPVDVNVRSLYVGKNPVIDSLGKWIGSSSGLVGPAGPKGETGPQGPQGIPGLKGDTGSTGPKGDRGDAGPQGEIGPAGPRGEKGDKGDRGEAGEGCWFDDKTRRINCAGGTWIDISQLKGPAGERGPVGLKGDQGAKGDKGDQGEAGQGCWYDDRMQRINCAGGTWIPITLLKGPEGERGPMGVQGLKGEKGDRGDTGPKGIVGACRQVTETLGAEPSGLITTFAECAVDELVMTGGCTWNSQAGAILKSFGPSPTQRRYYCTADRDTSKRPLWGQLEAVAVCCKK